MSGEVMTADLAAMISRGREVQDLAARLAACLGRVEKVMADFRQIQLLEWQSPAGRAYRNSIAHQEVVLGRARVQLEDAVLAVDRYAQEVASAPAGSGNQAGPFPWPR
jgi:hypothetical protein